MSLLENLSEPIHLRQSSTTNLLSFGAQTVMDPISGSMVYPWRVNVLQDTNAKTVTLQLTGIPYTAPNVGDTFEAYMLVQDTSSTDSALTDVVKITWTI